MREYGPMVMDKTQPPTDDNAARALPHILLVEDDAELSRLVVQTLHDGGFTATAAADTK